MTPQEIRSKFEHGAPDRFLAFYYAVLAVVGDEITCDRYKQQRIAIIASAAKVGEEAWAKSHAALAGGLDG